MFEFWSELPRFFELGAYDPLMRLYGGEEMEIAFRDGSVTLVEGELFVVPKGVEHKPSADRECHVLLIEPRGVVNTGEEAGALTAENDVWI